MEVLSFFWNSRTRGFVLWLLRWFYPIKKGRVVLVSWNGVQYNCNPRAIAEAILRDAEAADSFELNYAFVNPDNFPEVPAPIHKVELGSLEYYHLIATAQFIISNVRFAGIYFPYKKRGQTYIQTQHGGHGIKRVEFDADLPHNYLRTALEDTRRTDLMLSDSSYWTQVYRTAYRYYGEVSEQGLPRNDIFFADQSVTQGIRCRVLEYTMVPHDAKMLVYTPTFRAGGRRDVYGFDPDVVVAALHTRFSGEWYILVSSHPNMRSYYREIYDFSHPRMIDVGTYSELQELLVSADALITDYSSAEMDFSLTGRPVFQLIRDLSDYDRGTYISPKELPFPYAETDEELVHNIETFNAERYADELARFNREVIGLNETGHASEAVVQWMLKHIDNP